MFFNYQMAAAMCNGVNTSEREKVFIVNRAVGDDDPTPFTLVVNALPPATRN